MCFTGSVWPFEKYVSFFSDWENMRSSTPLTYLYSEYETTVRSQLAWHKAWKQGKQLAWLTESRLYEKSTSYLVIMRLNILVLYILVLVDVTLITLSVAAWLCTFAAPHCHLSTHLMPFSPSTQKARTSISAFATCAWSGVCSLPTSHHICLLYTQLGWTSHQ